MVLLSLLVRPHDGPSQDMAKPFTLALAPDILLKSKGEETCLRIA